MEGSAALLSITEARFARVAFALLPNEGEGLAPFMSRKDVA